eukprot:15354115-Ditylum_brightwellii.AAC.1
MQDDVNLGYGIPLPLDIFPKILFVEVYPLRIQHQKSIDELGNVITKDRVNHDLLFPKDKLTINDRVIVDLLKPCHYGHPLRCLCHYIHNLCHFYSTTRILMHKCNIKKAYCLLHTQGCIAAACIAVIRKITVALLCLPFGLSPAPTKFNIASEIVLDLSNDLLTNPFWNPALTHSPNQELIRPPERLVNHISFGPALETEMYLHNIPLAKTDRYLDGSITVALDLPSIINRAIASLPLALHLIFCPLTKDKAICHTDVLSLQKLAAKGTL